MINSILDIETLLNILNTVFAKASSVEDKDAMDALGDIRNKIYYDNFVYDEELKKINEINEKLTI